MARAVMARAAIAGAPLAGALMVAAVLCPAPLGAQVAAGQQGGETSQQNQPASQPGTPPTGATPQNHQTPLPSAPRPMPPAQLGPDATRLTQIGPVPAPPPDPRRSLPTRPGALSIEQVLTLARSRNPVLRAARLNLEGTRAQEIQAGVRANPYFAAVGSDVTLLDGSSDGPYLYAGQVSRLFERGQKRRWRLDVARSTTAQTEAQLHDQERGTEFAVKQAFTNMLIAKAALTLANANLADFRREVAINEDRYKAGDIGKLDFERLDLQLSQFESDQANAQISLRQASDQLQTLIGVETPSEDFDILGTIVPPPLSIDLAGVDAKALASRPDYQAALAAVAVADANVKLAYANGTTDPTIEAEYDRSGNSNSAGFNVSIPLRLFDRNQGNKKTSEFVAQGSRFSVIAAKNQVLSDVDQAWIGYTQSKVLADRYTSHYLDEAGDVLQIAQFAYEHGGIALIDYLDALRDSRSTTAAALSAYANTWLAIHQLSYASATEMVP